MKSKANGFRLEGEVPQFYDFCSLNKSDIVTEH